MAAAIPRLTLPSEPQLPEVHNLHDAMSWCTQTLHRIVTYGLMIARSVAQLVANRRLTTSSCFSGMGTPEIADAIISNSVQEFIKHHWDASWGDIPEGPEGGLDTSCAYAADFDAKCREELLAVPGKTCPQHVFGDVREVVAQDIRQAVGLDGGVPLMPSELREKMRSARNRTAAVRRQAWCYKCGKECRVTRTHVHTAGSPCVDHSMMNQKRLKEDGPKFSAFIVWTELMLLLKPFVIIHENVKTFGYAPLQEAFGESYFIIRIEVNPESLGWASRRPRQYCVLVLKSYVSSLYQRFDSRFDKGTGTLVQDISEIKLKQMFVEDMDLGNTLRHVFYRNCRFTWRSYMCASEEELELEREWLASRPCVRKRKQDEAILTEKEEERLKAKSRIEKQKIR